MNIEMICICSDLGIVVNGSEYGPIRLHGYFEHDKRLLDILIYAKPEIVKSLDKDDKRKNIVAINAINKFVYDKVLNIKLRNSFPLVIGGDHSVAIASCLANIKSEGNLGLIWISAHGDYNTFESTITGNIRGMALATINGINGDDLTHFFDGNYHNPANTVIIGTRNLDSAEFPILNEAGVTFFTTSDIDSLGIESIMRKAIDIASNGTKGIHVSYDLGIIDPTDCPGVSIPVIDGISRNDAFVMLDIIFQYKRLIKGFDLVEYNPTRDLEHRSYTIAINTIEKVISSLKE